MDTEAGAEKMGLKITMGYCQSASYVWPLILHLLFSNMNILPLFGTNYYYFTSFPVVAFSDLLKKLKTSVFSGK